MLTFVTVNAGDYLGRGKEYVEVLFDSIRRNLKEGTEGRFICFTDDDEPYAEGIEKRALHGNLKGWYNKLYLFNSELFYHGDRIIFFDLDTVIVSGLDEIIKYDGPFATLRDFYRPKGLQSSVIMWENGKADHVWKNYVWMGLPELKGGDQEFIESYYGYPVADILQDLFPNCFVSYKAHCLGGIPKNAKVVVFHGNPRPHATKGWVEKIWKVGGGSALELEMQSNVDAAKLEANIRHSLTLDLPHFETLAALADNQNAVLVGGGPSIKDYVSELRFRQRYGEKIFALNGAYKWLSEKGIKPDYLVIADARPENASFVPEQTDAILLIASHCDKAVFEKAAGKKVIVWHRGHDGVQDIVDPDRTKTIAYFAGGSTVGMIAMSLAYACGYRKLHLFGYDSSYLENDGHAYSQKLNDADRILDIEAYGRDFKSAPWMVQQANEFIELAPALVKLGCEISTHGDGLLQHIAASLSASTETETEIHEINGDWWPRGDVECRASIEAFSSDVDAIIKHVEHAGVCIQAGGNVGMWPKKLAGLFDSVYTFEPDNANFQCLCRNVPELNVIKMQAILGSRRGLVKLATTRHNCGAHFVDGNGIIPTLRIDDLGLDACDLIQLDVEGFEYSALLGAGKTIDKFKPVIVCEEKGLGEKFGISDEAIGVFLGVFGYEVVERLNRDVVYKHKGIS